MIPLKTRIVDLAILDIAMPGMTGLHAARELKQRQPEIRVLILSMHENEQYLYEALKAGASGYVFKTVADRDLVQACRAAMRGEPFLYPGVMTALIRDYLRRAHNHELPREDPLTPREVEVVKLIAEGHSSKQIAEMLVISEKTVERHRANILEKLGDARPRPAHSLRDPTAPHRGIATLMRHPYVSSATERVADSNGRPRDLDVRPGSSGTPS